MNNKILTIIIVILVGVGTFFAGTKYQESKSPTFARQFTNNGQETRMNGQFQGNGNNTNRMGFRPVMGEIISSDDKSITVKMQDGSSKIVLVSDSTDINKADKANKEELKVGEKVSVFGTSNSDGSVTAQSIQLNPIIRAVNNSNSTPSAK